jgi:predicted MPP superfamily phosphohydrolase
MRLAWLTDIHLNFLNYAQRTAFYDLILEKNPEAILITGDISEAPKLNDVLEEMGDYLNVGINKTGYHRPIYFVLGNHDFYHSSIKSVRENIIEIAGGYLKYLRDSLPVYLTKSTSLIGIDCFADGRAGNYHTTRIRMNDHSFIEEFNHARICSNNDLLKEMQEQSEGDNAELLLTMYALKQGEMPKNLIIMMHVPPFEECCLYGNKKSDADFLPFYCSVKTGEILLSIAEKHPETNFLVLCGHTHSKAIYQPLPNLTVRVGEAEYTEPRINMLEIKEDGAIVFDDE